MSNAPPPFGTLDGYRMPIAELLGKIEVYARVGQDYVGITDDAGLNHTLRCLTAYTQTAVDLLGELKELKEKLRVRASGENAR